MMKPNSHFQSLALFFLFLFFSPSSAHKKAHQASPPPVTPPSSDCNPPPPSFSPPVSQPPVTHPPPPPPVSSPPLSSSPPVSHPPPSSSSPPVSTPACDCNTPPSSSSPPVSHPPPSSSPPVSHPPSSSSYPPVSTPPASDCNPPPSSSSPPVSTPPASDCNPPPSSSSPPVSHPPSSSSPPVSHLPPSSSYPPVSTPPASDCNPSPSSSSPPVSHPPSSSPPVSGPPVSYPPFSSYSPPVSHPPSSSSSPPVSHRTPSSSSPPVSHPPSSSPPVSGPPVSHPPVSHPPSSSSSPPVSHPPSSSPPVSGPPVSHPPVSHPPFSSYSPPVSHPPSSSSSPPVSGPPVSHTPSSSPPVSSPPSPPSSSPPSPLEGSFKGCFNEVFAFGDSYTDTGNAHLLGDMISPSGSGSGSTCNGRKVVDYLCDALSIPHLAPYKDSSANFNNGVNFAVGGSTSLPKDSTNGTIPRTMFKGTPKTLQTQIDWFDEFLQNKACKGKDVSTCKADMGKALFWIGSMGVNDYTRASGSSSFNIQGLADMSITHMSKLMQTLLTNGAQNIVVQGLPPVGCLSSGKSLCPLKIFDKMGCSLTINTAVMVHNKILQQMLTKFQSQFPGCKIIYADYWNAFMEIFTHPKQFNFEEPFKACCGAGDSEFNFNINSVCGSAGTSTCKDPSKYMNWDGIHLTESMHQHISDLFLNQNFCRPSFSQLFKNKIGM